MAFYPVKQAAPWRARHLLAEEIGKFSPENLRDKMSRRTFYPALRCLPALRRAARQFLPVAFGHLQSGLGWLGLAYLIKCVGCQSSFCGRPNFSLPKAMLFIKKLMLRARVLMVCKPSASRFASPFSLP